MNNKFLGNLLSTMKKVLAKYNGRTKNRASTLPITNEESLTEEAALKLSLKGYILYSHTYT